jgi:hypothetical protein
MSVLHWESTNALWMSRVVVVAEVAIGAALILGLFTGVFALLGLVLNFSYMFSGLRGSTRRSSSPPSCWCWPGATPAGSGSTASCCRTWAPLGGNQRQPPRGIPT